MEARSNFHVQLEQLKLAVLHMAALTEKALDKAIGSLLDRDASLAEEVIREDAGINQLEVDVDRKVLKLLALEQPVASDLRDIIGYLRIAGELERIGDQAVNIAQRCIFLCSRPPLPSLPQLEKLWEAVMDMFRSSTAALMNQNPDLAMEVCEMDDDADDLNIQVLKTLIDRMIHSTPAIERSVHTIIVARSLERVGDLCTNIAESIIFMVKGVNIKHGCE